MTPWGLLLQNNCLTLPHAHYVRPTHASSLLTLCFMRTGPLCDRARAAGQCAGGGWEPEALRPPLVPARPCFVEPLPPNKQWPGPHSRPLLPWLWRKLIQLAGGCTWCTIYLPSMGGMENVVPQHTRNPKDPINIAGCGVTHWLKWGGPQVKGRSRCMP